MNKLVIIALLCTFGISKTVANSQDKSLKVCQSYISEAKAFEKTMTDDEMSQATLNFYKEKILVHCGRIVAKTKFEKKSFSEMMMKSESSTKKECRQAIDMAGAYSKKAMQSEIIVAAHKENIADKCGTLVAGHVSSYCLFGDDK